MDHVFLAGLNPSVLLTPYTHLVYAENNFVFKQRGFRTKAQF